MNRRELLHSALLLPVVGWFGKFLPKTEPISANKEEVDITQWVPGNTQEYHYTKDASVFPTQIFQKIRGISVVDLDIYAEFYNQPKDTPYCRYVRFPETVYLELKLSYKDNQRTLMKWEAFSSTVVAKRFIDTITTQEALSIIKQQWLDEMPDLQFCNFWSELKFKLSSIHCYSGDDDIC